jgi:hypothetical protein
MSDIKTSDTKPKRAAREPAQGQAMIGDAAVAEVVAAVTAPVVGRNIVPKPDPVSPFALAQGAPGGPACPVPVAAQSAPSERPPDAEKPPEASAETAWTAFADAQSALARGFEQAAVEMTGIGRSGLAATADAAVALLGARTIAEAIEINAALVRRSLDSMFESSARLSEIGAKAVADASRPMLSRYGWRWSDGRGGDTLGLS